MVAACEGGNLDVVKWLYLNGASLTATTADLETPMWGACANGHLDIAKWIYSVEMVDLAAVTVDGLTYMMAACSSGHLETAKWLYSVGASVHTVNTFEENAMTLACEYGDLSVVEWLHQKGLGVSTPNAIGQTPLMLACSNGHLKLARWLFDHGAHLDIHLPDFRGVTALGRACIVGALAVAKWLYAEGARLTNDVSNPWADVRLDDVAYYAVVGKHWEVIFWLHEKGARLIPNLLAHVDPGLACRMIVEGLASTDARVDQVKLHHLRDPDTVRDLLSRRLKDNSEFYRLMNEAQLPVWCLVAEFAGVLRGRALRNVREALAILI
jgi:ankyrin repeat protein